MFVLALGLAIVAWPSVARADEATKPRSAFALRAELDVPILLIGGGVTAGFFFLDETPGVGCGLTCSRSSVNAFDRWAAGRYDLAWGNVGDVATAATLSFAPLVVLLHEGVGTGAADALVVAEAALLTSALQVSVSYAVSRPRPRVYADDAPYDARTDANAARSFFSGHVGDAVAATVAATRVFHRLGRPTLGWIVFSAGMTGSSIIATGRVLSGGHFPSDVLVGAAVGAGFGLLVPWLHERRVDVAPMAGADAGGLSLAGRF